ncbi:MAG: sulfite exporter TauE/SafE family protein [Bacteroidota bacterium]
MEIIGYMASAVIGLSLGLIGGGGSILTVPVLVYLFNQDPLISTSYSLFIVGITSLVGSVPKFRAGDVDFSTAFFFGLPSIVSVYLTRAYLLPSIPDVLISFGSWELTKSLFLLVLFALLMLAASISMIRESKVNSTKSEGSHQKRSFALVLAEGAVVGILTGLVGAGGGFLIIPALVVLSGLPMKKAIGTSLLIIAAKSLIGFTGDLGKYPLDWNLLLPVTGIAIVGIFAGGMLSRKIDGASLKKGFGWFVLVTGAYILIKELSASAA